MILHGATLSIEFREPVTQTTLLTAYHIYAHYFTFFANAKQNGLLQLGPNLHEE